MNPYKPARFRRFLAFWLDFFLAILGMVLIGVIGGLLRLSGTAGLILTVCMLIPFVLFLCRDFLLNGRSIGKRILGLAVVDRESGAPATAKQLAIKAIFLFFYLFDGLFLLFSGRSLGERATHTAVIRSRAATGPLSKKRWLAVIAALLAFVLLFAGLFAIGMASAKKADGYQPALDYLVSSDAFAMLGGDADDVELTGFAFSSRVEADGPVNEQTFHFVAAGEDFSVTCHPDAEGVWQVCSDCTDFH